MVCHHCEALAKKHGKDRKGLQRFRCVPCNRTFTEYQEKPLEGMYLPLDKAVMVLNMLLEGMSLRSVSRLTGVEMHTILKLLVLAGEKSQRLLFDKVKALEVQHVQADELWGFCKMKARTKDAKQLEDDHAGTFYCFVGMDESSKLVLAHQLGQRDMQATITFIHRLSEATTGRFQLSTDAFPTYREALSRMELGERVDYGQIVKIYANPLEKDKGAKRYSPTRFMKAIRKPISGRPEMARTCTSHIERLNLSIRTQVKRLARLTLSFSRKWENLQAMMHLYFAFYNFMRPHKSLNGVTPAMAHGIEKTFWTIEDLLRY